ncbi:MAG: hypothetical protein ACKVQJ_05585 [Pyrinomonadaceae bacterium]
MKYDFGTTCTGRREPPQLQYLEAELLKAIETINAIGDVNYRRSANATGSVGAQFRHNLDFVNSLLKGIDDGRIDYNRRERDLRVEENRAFAIERFHEAINRLNGLSENEFSKSVLVRSELDQSSWLPSSFIREVEFVHSHTVHHHALIAEKLAGYGIAAAENFGVAPSTLIYWETNAA